MRDYRAIGRASLAGITESELEGVAGPLEGLEELLRPLVSALAPDAEPATIFQPGQDEL
jgi:hypothetical protein